MTAPSRRRFRWHCRLLGAHDRVSRSAEDGSRYVACRRCGEGKREVHPSNSTGA